jgi:flagellar motor switch protein FliN/FliY
MLLDHKGIDDLLNQAEELVREAASAVETPAASGAGNSNAPPRADAPDETVRRLLRIRVPVIVQLAAQRMALSVIRNLAPGSILEFDKSVDSDLELLINNRCIGLGTCVKVGENFGLRITQIKDAAARVRSLGK